MNAGTKFAIGAALIVGSVGYLMASGVQQTGQYFLTPTELSQKIAVDPSFYNVGMKVGAHVVRGSVTKDVATQTLSFQVTDERALSRRLPRAPSRHVHGLGRGGGRGPPAAVRRDPRDQRARQVRVALRIGAQGLDDGPRQSGAVARPARRGLGRAGRVRGGSPGTARPRAQRPAGGVRDVRRAARRRVRTRVGAVPARLQRRVRRRVHQPEPPDLLYVVGAVRGPEGQPAL